MRGATKTTERERERERENRRITIAGRQGRDERQI